MEDLITLYRGVDKVVDDFTPKNFEGNIGKGRWYTPDINIAKSYVTKPGGAIYSMDVPSSSISQSNKLKQRLISKGYDWMDNAATLSDDVVLGSKKLITEGDPKINCGQTALTNLEALGDKGLGFLKNYGLKGLQILASLPAQAGIMTLSPTMMGNAELPQMPKGPPSIINQGGNGGGNGGGNAGGAQLSSGMTTGQHAAFRMNNGGLINLYRYGGFI